MNKFEDCICVSSKNGKIIIKHNKYHFNIETFMNMSESVLQKYCNSWFQEYPFLVKKTFFTNKQINMKINGLFFSLPESLSKAFLWRVHISVRTYCIESYERPLGGRIRCVHPHTQNVLPLQRPCLTAFICG